MLNENFTTSRDISSRRRIIGPPRCRTSTSPTTTARAPKVREMFSRLAWRYDLVNDLMSFGLHRRWKRETVRLARRTARGARRACSTSAAAAATSAFWPRSTAPRASRAPTSRCRCSPSRGAGEASREGRRSAFVQADALALPFPDAAFDAITVGYGLRNVADLPAALAEMRRVLAPGRARRDPRFRQARQSRRARPLRRVPAHRDAADRLALPRRPGHLPLHPGVARALPRPARRRAPDARGRASPTPATRTGCSERWGSTSARRPLSG